MATMVQESPAAAGKDSFYFRSAAAMAIIVVAGFSMQWAMGRSTFAARPLVHLHALVFMTWVGIFVAQSWFASNGSAALHRRLGQLAAVWTLAMILLGFWITIDVIQRGTAPFFFQPQHFLIANPVNVLCFAVLIAVALKMRRRRDWHMRLQLCAMAAILGPAFGRLLPMPLLGAHAWDIALLCGLAMPAVGMARDLRREGRVHPAWWWGILGILAPIPIAHLIAFSPLGDAVYAFVTSGHPGAAVDGLAFAPPPTM